ncbi:MAG: response regulator [Gammaproteobacteria bacterium]
MAKILLVDDDAAVLKMLSKTLQRGQHEIITATNGEEALEIITNHSNRIDLIITDIVMPRRVGLYVIRTVKQTNPHLKIIAISGGGLEGPTAYLEAAQTHGADYVFQKPIKPEELLDKITELVAK